MHYICLYPQLIALMVFHPFNCFIFSCTQPRGISQSFSFLQLRFCTCFQKISVLNLSIYKTSVWQYPSFQNAPTTLCFSVSVPHCLSIMILTLVIWVTSPTISASLHQRRRHLHPQHQDQLLRQRELSARPRT